MGQKRLKKALSHVDWAMSLAIFLLYLAWFFIFVKPLFAPSQNMNVLLDILEKGVREEFYSDIERYNIYVSQASEDEPVIVDFEKNWTLGDTGFTCGNLVFDSGKLFFMANTSASRSCTAYHPVRIIKPEPRLPPVSDREHVFYGSSSFVFENSIPVSGIHSGELSFSGLYFADEDFYVSNFSNISFLAKYTALSDDLSVTSYSFPDNPRIYAFIEPVASMSMPLSFGFVGNNYTDYYISPTDTGELRYGLVGSCYYHQGSMIDLFNADSGFAVILDKNATIRVCTNETNPSVMINLTLDGGLKIIFAYHGSSLPDMSLGKVGARETLEFLSMDNARLLANRDYALLQQRLDFPYARDFNISFVSDDYTATYGIEAPAITDVYARKIYGVYLKDDLSQGNAVLSLRVW